MIKIEDLRVRINDLPAINGVNLSIPEGKTLALVGESGSGKSLTALSIMGLLPPKAQATGQILFDNQNILNLPDKEARYLRGNTIGMIFQDPMTALNPTMRIGAQICEGTNLTQADAIDALEGVGLPDPPTRIHSYPHQLSGGQRQRAIIAMILARKPRLIIADEPTTALDVTTQRQVLNLLRAANTTILLITHDLGVVANIADEVAVMYGGRIMETNNVYDLFKSPRHPYTQGLLNSVPRIDGDGNFTPIPGAPPTLRNLPKGCPFAPRCVRATDQCKTEIPQTNPACFYVES